MPQDYFHRRALALADELAALRTAVYRHVRELGATPDVGEAVRLAVGEALTNVVEAWLDEQEELMVRVPDDGRGLVPHGDSPGLGLGVMAQMADDFRIANREATPGTIMSMRLSLTRIQRDSRVRRSDDLSAVFASRLEAQIALCRTL